MSIVTLRGRAVTAGAEFLKSDHATARLARGATWNLLATAAVHFSAVLGAIITSRLLGPVAFGKFGIINATVGMSSAVAALGIGITATKHLAEFRDSDGGRARRLLDLTMAVGALAGLSGTVLLYLAAGHIARAALHAPEIAPALRLASPLVMLSVLAGAHGGILAGFERFRVLAGVNLLRCVITVPATAALIAMWRLDGAIVSLLFSNALGLLVTGLAIRGATPGDFPRANYLRCWSEWRVLASFSLPSVLNTVSVAPVQWALTAWLVNVPNGFVQMGVYAAGNQVRTLITYLPSALGQPAIAMLSRDHAVNPGRFRPLFRHTLRLGCGLALATGLPALLGSPWILAIYHPDFKGSWPALCALVLSGILQVPGWIGSLALSSTGRMWTSVFLQWIWAVATLAPAWLLVPRYGALGLGCALAIGYGFDAPASLAAARRAAPRGPEAL